MFGSGPDAGADTRDTLAALDWLITSRPDVRLVNLSLGGDPTAAPCDGSATGIAYGSAVAALRARGVTVFASSGNEGSLTGLSAPACVTGIVSVGAVYDANLGSYATEDCSDPSTAPDLVACYSNGGLGLDLLAPGPDDDHDESRRRDARVRRHLGRGALRHRRGRTAPPGAAGPRAGQPRSCAEADGRARRGRADGPHSAARRRQVRLRRAPGVRRRARAADAAGRRRRLRRRNGGRRLGRGREQREGHGELRGLVTFTVSLANRVTLGANDSINVFVDADRNAATGASVVGAEYGIALGPGGETQLQRWSGAWQFVRPVDNGAFANGAFTFSIDQAELGLVGDFGFSVVTFAGGSPVDMAPATGTSPYPAFTLSVARVGTGAGTVSGGGANGVACGDRCSAPLARGAGVQLTAQPAAGSAFIGWEGACSGAGTCALTMDEPKQVAARFELLRRLTVTRTGTGIGRVTGTPGGVACPRTCLVDLANGTTATLTATPAAGSVFAGWSGACTGTGSCSLTLSAAVTVSAAFRDVQAPRATALPSSGRRGGLARLRYRLADNSGRSAAVVTVHDGGRRLARISRPVARTGVSSALWRVPRTAPGALRFCVRPRDRQGNRGALRCARLSIR